MGVFSQVLGGVGLVGVLGFWFCGGCWWVADSLVC